MERARPDYYRVLQVDPVANPLVIQAAYRALAQIFHPDLFGDEDEMKQINAAWEVLGDPRRRREYDLERAGRASNQEPAAARPAAKPRSDDHAGPPQGTPFGPVLRFGRYEGWTLGQVARVDRPWLEWLMRVPAGRGFKDEIDAVLRTRKGPGAVDEARHYETNRHKVHAWTPGAPTKIE